MPSPNSSDETQADARAIAANLGVELIEISIAEAMEAYGTRWRRRSRAASPALRKRTSRRGSAEI